MTAVVLILALAGLAPDGPKARANAPVAADAEVERTAVVAPAVPKLPSAPDAWKSVQTVGLFALVSAAIDPAARARPVGQL